MVARNKKKNNASGGKGNEKGAGPPGGLQAPVPPGKRQKGGSGSAAAAADAYMSWLTGDAGDSHGSSAPRPAPKAVGVVHTTPPTGQVIPPLNGGKGGFGNHFGGYAHNQMPSQETPHFQQPELQQFQQPSEFDASPQTQQQYLPPVETNPYALAVQAGWSRDEVLLMQAEGIARLEVVRGSLTPEKEKKALEILVTLKEQMHQLKVLQTTVKNRKPPAPPQPSPQQQAEEEEKQKNLQKKQEEEAFQQAYQQQMRRAEMHTQYEQQMASQFEQIQAQQIEQMQIMQQQMEQEQRAAQMAALPFQAQPQEDRQDDAPKEEAPKPSTNHMTELQCSILHNTMLSQQAFLRDQVAQLESQLERTPDGLQQQLEQQKQMIQDAMQQVQQTQAMAAEQIQQLQAQAVLTNEETEHMQQLQQHQQMQEQHYQQLQEQLQQVNAQAEMEPHYRHKLLKQQLDQHQLHLDPQYQQLLRKQAEAASTEQDAPERKGDPDTGGFIEELQQTGQLRGTKICIFYLCSRCRKGFRCPDRHPSEADCNLARAEYASKPCRLGDECRTANCLYFHESGDDRIGLKGQDDDERRRMQQQSRPPPDLGPGSGPEAARKAQLMASRKDSTEMRPGDWFCPKCNNLNFRYRTNCKTARCREPRPTKI
eukprot:gnl/MRDRNA2_/MRDRNA2_122865_c0_seq1.p1 gnl/MRDRNA2_/MRDRNA2_122865_c0~~gnl/MRDRNA2_/MRDRNA2_122865_c0_seq1.p1  ORF type:complete len:650 (+),score=186.70 gnl/MRDRNA2_/MRDRNA2_122865_c0_seq1:57-2006(+)